MTVFFIGAGPGDPELITVKGQRLVRSCPVILYAGSLVPSAVLEGHSAVQPLHSMHRSITSCMMEICSDVVNGVDSEMTVFEGAR